MAFLHFTQQTLVFFSPDVLGHGFYFEKAFHELQVGIVDLETLGFGVIVVD